MSSCVLALVALVAAPPEAPAKALPASTAQLAEDAHVSQPAGRQLEKAARDALRRWAKPTDAEADRAAREFLALFTALRRDTKLAAATRDSLRIKVRGRLARLSEQISRRVAREHRAADKRAESVGTPQGRSDKLAQFAGPRVGPGGGMPAAGGFGLGGPGGRAARADYGQALVDLIQRTIAPSTWEVNGGLGSIYYWQPGRALVIRQTGDVHEQLGDALDQLGRAGR